MYVYNNLYILDIFGGYINYMARWPLAFRVAISDPRWPPIYVAVMY